MLRKNGIAALQARIEKELNDIREVVNRVEEKRPEVLKPTPNDLIVAGLAAYVQSFYNGVENIFNLIAQHVDNFQPQGGTWHKNLLEQMSLEIKGVRPSVIRNDLVNTLKDYLEFRHFFRHAYSFHLDWKDVEPKVIKLKETFTQLEADFQKFFSFLQSVSDHIE